MQNPENVRLLIFLVMLAVMGMVESFWHVRPWETGRLSRWICHGFWSFINTLWTRALVLTPFILWLNWIESHSWGIARGLGLRGNLGILVTVLAYDAYNYWWHRFNHEWSWLWRFHQVHHMDTHLDVTTALRFHPGELLIAYGAKAIWVLVWGPSVAAFIITEMIITTYTQFHHANIDFPDGVEKWLRKLHMTPRLHASHHTVTRRTRDANYAAILTLWDYLFGSYREPDWQEMQQLGLPEGRTEYLRLTAMFWLPFTAQAKNEKKSDE